MPGTGNSCEVLVVEDLWSDARITIDALKKRNVFTHIHHVEDGEKALAYLRRQGEYAAAPRPDLILLDLNLPKIDGREVLEEVKRDRQLRRIPVVIITSSRAEEDLVNTYDLHANCYITKPDRFEEYTRVAESIEDFWLHLSELPDTAE